MASLHEELVTASTERAIRSAVANGQVAVWLPTDMVLSDALLPSSWDLTSDSLSAWLARKLKSNSIILVKHAASEDIEALTNSGAVDPLFTKLLDGTIKIRVLGPREASKLRMLLRQTGNEGGAL